MVLAFFFFNETERFIFISSKSDDAEHKHKTELKANNGLQNLINSLSAASDKVKEKSLAAIFTFVSSSGMK